MYRVSTQFLDYVIESWHKEVLGPNGFLNSAINCEDERYVERYAAAKKFGANAVDSSLRRQRKGEVVFESAMDDYFCAFQDFLNYYGREVLSPLQLITPDYYAVGLDHPFYEQRRKFISRMVKELLEKQKL